MTSLPAEVYAYDDLNQLVSANLLGNSYTYTYDVNGNILTAVENGVTHTYTYGNSRWRDLLTAYDGYAITYDQIGNPLTYRNGMRFLWQNGRQLETSLNSNSSVTHYTYNADGTRHSKSTQTNVVTTTTYYYVEGTLYAIDSGAYIVLFRFDESGTPYGFDLQMRATGQTTTAYYKYNLQGDVVGIYDTSGNQVVAYTYDPWGKLLSATGSSVLIDANPLLYRGYVYDKETGFYYCNSRYYDPEIGRWINADSQLNTSLGVLGCNMFAYCLNNPANKVDYGGNKPGDLFNTMDEAAKDAAIYLGALSFENGWEYITVIYSVNKTEKTYKTVTKTHKFLWWSWTDTSTKVIKTKVKKYTYKTVRTDKDPWSVSIPRAPLFRKRLATVHTHPMGSGQGITRFSEGDIKTANDMGLVDYVYGPNGQLRRYDPSTGKEVCIFFDLPISTKRPWLD